MAAPVTQKIGTPFGRKGAWAAGYHPGEDYPCAPRTPVKAAADGKVIYRGNGGGWGGAYGTHVIVESKGTDGRTYRWIVAHLTPSSWKVKAGDAVKLGQVIGLSGFSGNVRPAGAGGAHVHFEVRAYNRSTRDGIFGYWDHVNPTVIRNVKATAPSKPSTNKMDPAGYFTGAVGAHVTWLGERLVLLGFGKHYTTGPGPVWGEADRKNVRDFQIAQGWTGDGADGFPGALTLTRLAAAPPAPPVPPVPSAILPRSAWTNEPNARENDPLSVAKVTAFTIHYPGDGDVTYRDLTQSEVAARLKAYRESHLGRGWKDIGYNYSVDQSGRTWFLTGDNVGAHSGDAGNPTSIAVLFVVGNNEAPTPAAIEAFRLLRASKLPRFPKATSRCRATPPPAPAPR